jgi:hypothetical protein
LQSAYMGIIRSLAIIPHLANDNSDKQQASHDHPRRAKGSL